MPTPRRYPSAAARQAAYRRRRTEGEGREPEGKAIPRLPAIAITPGRRRWQDLIGQASLLLRTVEEEMQGYFDQRSESWQESDRGDAFLESLRTLEEAQSELEELQL